VRKEALLANFKAKLAGRVKNTKKFLENCLLDEPRSIFLEINHVKI
jgi:hypothetical protein